MADMAAPDQLEMCWRELSRWASARRNVVPVTYINSAAAIKAFVGEHGGIVCTSGNAAATLRGRGSAARSSCSCPTSTSDATPPTRWACRSTRWWCGIRTSSGAASSRSRCKPAKLILWKGHCSVHTRFTVQQIEAFRKQHPGIRVIVAPGMHVGRRPGRRRQRLHRIHHEHRPRQPAGIVWAVGTEIHLVNRLANEVAPDKTVITLDQFGCLCSTMFRVSPNHLLWILDGLVEGKVHNRIVVPDDAEAASRWRSIGCCDASSPSDSAFRPWQQPRRSAITDSARQDDARSERQLPSWLMQFPRFRTTTTRSSRTSTSRRWRSTTASITRPTSTTSTPRSRSTPSCRTKSVEELLRDINSGAGGHPHRRAQQRRRPRQPHDVLGDHGARAAAASRPARSRDAINGDVRRLRRVQGAVQRRPASGRFGSGWAWLDRRRRQARRSRARRTRTAR